MSPLQIIQKIMLFLDSISDQIQCHKRTRNTLNTNRFYYPNAQLHEVPDMFQAFATQEDEEYTCPDFPSEGTHIQCI